LQNRCQALDAPGKSEDAPGHNKPEPKNLVEPNEPYPTGKPPSADDEKRRAAGLPPDAKL